MLRQSNVWARLTRLHNAARNSPAACADQVRGAAGEASTSSPAGREVPVYNLDFEQVGTTSLPADVFGVEVRKDILHRVVRWQRAKTQQGTHKAKTRAEVRGGGRKPHPQKGTGKARQGSIRSPQFRGGGKAHGPVPRSHAHDLPKKVRRLGLKCALSARASEERLFVLDSLSLPEAKTKLLNKKLLRIFEPPTRPSALLVDSGKAAQDGGEQIRQAAANLHWVDVLPQEGLNVYSILRSSHLLLTRDALQALLDRLRLPIFRGPLDRAAWQASLQQSAARVQQQQQQ